jgi:hypothetical protein
LAADAESIGEGPSTIQPAGTLVAGTNLSIAEQRTRTSQDFPGLAEVLTLSEEDTEQLVDLLTESRMNLEGALRPSAGAVSGPDRGAAIQEDLRRLRELRREQEESIAALLGTTKYAQWQQYQQTLGARLEALSLGEQLAQLGQSLSSAQLKSLTTAVITEQMRASEYRETLARSARPMDARALGRLLQEEETKLHEERVRRILEAVESSLDAKQRETLRKQLEVQAAMNPATSNFRP